jgi:two-component system sensor histidine kinase KdpD
LRDGIELALNRSPAAPDGALRELLPVTDDFLAFVRAAKRGRLKVFLGMAAGVGKTVAMLREGRRLRELGVEVVVGVVLTHGRAETERERGELEVIPEQTIEYRGVPMREMDLDAILARRPDVALVHELAHTNVPGSRHDKRWEDVHDLLEAGISVLTTVNVQHLESLHELVLRETGVDVRERVPDRVLHDAHEVVVIDVPPDELQDRLRAGKIYPPHKIEQALQSFFRNENLAALRQIALREVANAVEARAEAEGRLLDRASKPAADAERVMVCMSSRPSGASRLLRRGARLAGGLNSKWFVLYVRTPSESTIRIDTASLRQVSENMNLAKELGAEIVRLEATDVAAALADFAKQRRITHAVFGRTRLSQLKERLLGSVLDRFMRLAPEVDVLVVGVVREEPAP